jgi:ABC-2 type transport system permease protein
VTPVRTVQLLAWRELRERLRSTGFAVSTLLSAGVIVVVVLVAGASGDDTTTYDVGVVGQRAAAVGEALDTIVANAGQELRVEVAVRELDDRATAVALVTDGDLDAALVASGTDGTSNDEADDGGPALEVVVDDELDDRLGALVQAADREVAVTGALTRAGASPEEAEAAISAPPPTLRSLDPEDPGGDRAQIAFIGVILLYGQVVGFGVWVASAIVEEKASRVVELLLAKATPGQLLTGKVVGIGVLGFVQLIAFVAFGLGFAAAVGTVDLPPGTGRVAVEVVAWFVLGFALYACLFAVGGAIASRPEELQTTTMPITMASMAALFAAVFAVNDPGGTVARLATFVPPAAPLVLPIRTAAGVIALWEAVLGAGLVVATIVAVIPLAGRIYAGGVLFTRGTLKLREALNRAGG